MHRFGPGVRDAYPFIKIVAAVRGHCWCLSAGLVWVCDGRGQAVQRCISSSADTVHFPGLLCVIATKAHPPLGAITEIPNSVFSRTRGGVYLSNAVHRFITRLLRSEPICLIFHPSCAVRAAPRSGSDEIARYPIQQRTCAELRVGFELHN